MARWLGIAGGNGAMAIGFAAYGAHGLAPQAAALVERASQFQLLHAVALLALARMGGEGGRLLSSARILMVVGVVAFSGSLYLKALGLTLPLPMITPFGGITLLLSWLLLVIAGFSKEWI